jgi:radical SAM superfamily enzyme YgiQ (UPF0313 family)
MRALLIYPLFPKTFWSFEAVLSLVGRKALIPPLGLITVAALLPQDWDFRLVDCNLRPVTEDDWAWADIVLMSGMIVQRQSFLDTIKAAKTRGKPVVVGGPYVTSVPEDAEAAGADYLVLDEGEITIPSFLDHIAEHGLSQLAPGEPARAFRAGGNKPEVTTTPIARFDLLDLLSYDGMAVQYSRGCPFLCEFCDIITLYGRRPRTKAPAQVLAELDTLYQLGWRRSIFLVDDNFIGNKRNVKKLLPELKAWQEQHGFPFHFDTEASIDLAADPELLKLMADSGFASVFIGVETPDADSLELTRKHQNNRSSMIDSIQTITHAGLRVMMGMIVGFDNEAKGAGERIVRFAETTCVPTVILSMLQALPNTGLWTRLEKEGRLRDSTANINQTTLLNFVPTRPVEQIADEYLRAYEALYDPRAYLDRTYRYFRQMGPPPLRAQARPSKDLKGKEPAHWIWNALWGARALAIVSWRQGIVRETRWMFWHHLFGIARNNPKLFEHYLSICAHNEHFLEYRQLISSQIQAQLHAQNDSRPATAPEETAMRLEPRALATG